MTVIVRPQFMLKQIAGNQVECRRLFTRATKSLNLKFHSQCIVVYSDTAVTCHLNLKLSSQGLHRLQTFAYVTI
jgi:hypothetical protein